MELHSHEGVTCTIASYICTEDFPCWTIEKHTPEKHKEEKMRTVERESRIKGNLEAKFHSRLQESESEEREREKEKDCEREC